MQAKQKPRGGFMNRVTAARQACGLYAFAACQLVAKKNLREYFCNPQNIGSSGHYPSPPWYHRAQLTE